MNNRYLVLISSFVITAGVQAYIIAPASIVPLFADFFSIGETAVSLSISAAIFGMLMVQIPSGLLMDRYDNRRLMELSTLVFVIASISGTAVSSYPFFLATRLIGGTGAGVIFTMGSSIVGKSFPNRRGLATSIFVSGAPFGFAIGQSVSPVVAGQYGWNAVFYVYSIVSILGIITFFLVATDPIRSDEQLSIEEFSVALRNQSVLILSLSGFCAYSLYMFMNSWMPTYANQTFSASLSVAGAAAALLPAVGILARPSGGWASDYLGRRRIVIASSFIFSIPLLFLIPRSPSIEIFMIFILLMGFFLQFSTGVYYAFVQELSNPKAVGTSLTVFSTIYLFGTLVSPILGGVLIDTFSWTVTFYTYIGIGLVGIVLSFAATDK